MRGGKNLNVVIMTLHSLVAGDRLNPNEPFAFKYPH